MTPELLRWQDLELDPGTRQLRLAGEPLRLTPAQSELLAYFLRHPQEMVTRDQLRSQVSRVSTSEQTLDRHMNGLRSRLRGRGKDIIQTVRGEGYILGGSEIISSSLQRLPS